MVEGRCMKCRENVEILDPEEVITKNGMKMLKGKCANGCGTTVCKIVGKA